ncbi:uncharacterized protein LOC131427017 [Malaya genurostris]|uniref:uncharacterized protein LOC131427017 n=1 Tax=Malaya genurostris TaxID=325434 RepID=UPI0026F3E7EA|nr:uncharacterized protein LOC131427017 [Malaya genurostris]
MKILVSPYLVLFSVLLSATYAIKCYRCNSLDDSACFHFNSESNRNQNDSVKPNSQLETFLQECGRDDKGREPFCRKISITILNNKHQRVIRECGYERSKNNCYKADNEDHLETVCQCWTDECNRAIGLEYKLTAFIAIIISFKILSKANLIKML